MQENPQLQRLDIFVWSLFRSSGIGPLNADGSLRAADRSLVFSFAFSIIPPTVEMK